MEKLYQYLWKYGMFGQRDFHLVDGREMRVISYGLLNNNAGPDFLNSRILLDNIEWAGNTEVHVRASDWKRHGHSDDPAYRNVILHVVGIDDERIARGDGSKIPQLRIDLPKDFFSLYETLSTPGADIRCRVALPDIPRLYRTDWVETLAMERLQTKAARIAAMLENNGGDWEQTAFATLARALGFGLNNDAFEMTARAVPLRYLSRHSDDPDIIEAFIFGQAGLLDSSVNIFDSHYQHICAEYGFVARKYGLHPVRTIWRFARTRPQNFPHRRLALLAKACRGGFRIMRDIIDRAEDPEALHALLGWRLDGYWKEHYAFGSPETQLSPALSRASVQLLLINFTAPLLFTYGRLRADERLETAAINLLHKLPPEKNSLLRTWESVGVSADNAFRSQALIHLRKEYCDKGRCVQCRFGHRYLRKAIADYTRK